MALGYHGRGRNMSSTILPVARAPHTTTVETINTGTANPSQDKWMGSGTFHGPIAAQGDATAQAKQAARGFIESRKYELLRQPGSGAGDVRKARGYQP